MNMHIIKIDAMLQSIMKIDTLSFFCAISEKIFYFFFYKKIIFINGHLNIRLGIKSYSLG